MFAYNHGKFVEQALKSILSQKTSFEVSLRIHDDASIDDTVQVIKRVLSGSGVSWHLTQATENRYPQGLAFFHEFMAETQAEFLAILDGDDFWIDDDKLQRQVDVLDRSPDAALCHHPVLEFSSGKLTTVDWPPPSYRQEIIQGSRLSFQNIISTSSVVLRTSMFPRKMPDGYNVLRIGDYPMWSLTTAGNDIAFVDHPMSAYRVHDSNIWASLDPRDKFDRELEARIYISSHIAEQFRPLWRSGIIDAVKNSLELAFNVERLAQAGLLAQAEIRQKARDAELWEAQQETKQILASRSWRLIKLLREIAGRVRHPRQS